MSEIEGLPELPEPLGISSANCHIGMMDVDACKAVVAVMRQRQWAKG